MDGSVHREER